MFIFPNWHYLRNSDDREKCNSFNRFCVRYDSLKKAKLLLQCQLVFLFTFIMVDGLLSLPKWRIYQCFHHKRLLSRDYITVC